MNAEMVDTDRNREIERDLDLRLQRRPMDSEDLRPLLRDYGVNVYQSSDGERDVIGRWARYVHDDGATLTLTRSERCHFNVRFETCGDLAEWTLERTASLEGGLLVLNRPVIEYCPAVYDRLYCIGETFIEYLVSQHSVRSYWDFYLRMHDEGRLQGCPRPISDYLQGRGLQKRAFEDE